MLDKFGITQLYPTAGLEWFSNWDNGVKRIVNSAGIDKRNQDPNDSLVSLHCPSHSSQGNQLIIYGNGQAKLRGQHPRLYVNNPDSSPLWLNTEMTIYGKFTKCIIKPESYTTFRLASRSNHQAEYQCVCNGKGYAHELFIKQDTLTLKDSRFRKELVHPHYANQMTNASSGVSMSTWIGQKFVCKTEKNSVKLEAYIDLTNGLNGGDWKLIGSFTDSGTWAVTEPKELEGIEDSISRCNSDCLDSKPIKPYNEKILRKGASCYLRSDFIQDSYFKNFSIREI